jgi:hypothetical protein
VPVEKEEGWVYCIYGVCKVVCNDKSLRIEKKGLRWWGLAGLAIYFQPIALFDFVYELVDEEIASYRSQQAFDSTFVTINTQETTDDLVCGQS